MSKDPVFPESTNYRYRYFVDWGNVGIGSPLKADDNWARQAREKSICFLSERGYSLVDKVPLIDWRQSMCKRVSQLCFQKIEESSFYLVE